MEFESPVFRMIEIEIGISRNDIWAFDEDDDIAYFRMKMASALRIPPELLNA
jgi:hypothetical protein